MFYEVKSKERISLLNHHSKQNAVPPAPRKESLDPVSPGYVHSAAPELSESQVSQAVTRLTQYIREGHEYYRTLGQPLSRDMVSSLKPFFSLRLLTRVRTVELTDRRLSNPSFYSKARSLGFTNLPDLAHKATITFLDVVVFNEAVTERNLFHALVHAAQFQALGIERYAELFLHGFLRAKNFSLVPLKAHAFALDARYSKDRGESFSVEEEVEQWIKEGKY